MGKKITVKDTNGRKRFCILKGENLKDEFNLFLFGEKFPSGGYSARFDGEELEIIDYISFDTVTTFKVLSIEETDEAETPRWIEFAP